MARKAKPIERQSISATIEGKTYSGSYSVSGKVVTVSYGGHIKTTQVGGALQATVARQLLMESVREVSDRERRGSEK